jgi:hypothetical protein
MCCCSVGYVIDTFPLNKDMIDAFQLLVLCNVHRSYMHAAWNIVTDILAWAPAPYLKYFENESRSNRYDDLQLNSGIH